MAQVQTALPTGVRAFNSVTVGDTTETEVIFAKPGDGGQFSLEEIDGQNSAIATIRVYAVPVGNAAPQQIGQVSLAAGKFNHKFISMLGAPDSVPVINLPYKAAQSMGIIGGGGIRITVQFAVSGTISMGAIFDRRHDGPFDMV
jgi:hypothetical protein